MSTHKNPDFIKTGNSETVTVSVTMDLANGCTDVLAMKNAVEAVEFYLNTVPRLHKTWARRIEVKRG